MIRAILFDAGDILYSKPGRKNSLDEFLMSRGYEASSHPDPIAKALRLSAHAGEISEHLFFKKLMDHYGVTNPQDVEEGVQLLHREQRKVVFFDGVADTLSELKSLGFKLGIVTNTYNSKEEKHRWFASIGIDQLWDSYANSCDLKVIKPDPQIYLAALDPINVLPKDAAFVGHAKTEIEGAKALVMTKIRFNPDPNCVESDFLAKKFSDLLNLSCIIEAKKAPKG
jgi:HAD superfamily hydrolase (TIGR01509 family)